MSIDCDATAQTMAAAIRAKEVSARELLEMHLTRIEQTNPTINAVVSLDPDRARDQAAAADDATAAGRPCGPLHGLPVAIKDTHQVAGWRTTFGSPLMAEHIPDSDDLVVERMKAAGAVILGKTNVPEWAAGSHTFNPIFGATYNPYDVTRSAGGSSGGAAAALACGMVALAEGTDMGGSLRNPASFCNVVGLRPSLGRVPVWPLDNAWECLSVAGPMGRTVEDTALLLSVIAGPDPRIPLASETPGSVFSAPPETDLGALRAAVSVDFGGAFAVEESVARVVGSASALLETAGARVEQTYPDLQDAETIFRTLRAWTFWHRYGEMLRHHPEAFKPALADNIRAGENLTGEDVAAAYQMRTALGERVRQFFDTHDVLVMPVSQVPPFPVGEEYPTQVAGQPQQTYLDWMRSAYFITVTGCPAISVPTGFTDEGWPVGVQLVGAPGSDQRLLEIARAYDDATGAGDRHPRLPGSARA